MPRVSYEEENNKPINRQTHNSRRIVIGKITNKITSIIPTLSTNGRNIHMK